jgi:hypothetical protein
MVIEIILLLATLIQGTTVTNKAWTCVMPAAANLPNPLFVPLSTRVLKSEVLPFDLTLFNQTPTSTPDVEPQLIVETTDVHYFFVALSVATAIIAVIVAAVLLIFMFFMFVALLFTKNHQKPRKSTKNNNKPRKSCDMCCDCCFFPLFPQQVQMVPTSTIEQVFQVVVEEEVLVEVEAANEIIRVAPPLPSPQQQQTQFQLQQKEVVVEEEVLVEVEATLLQSQQAPPQPTGTQQQQQTPLQLQQE